MERFNQLITQLNSSMLQDYAAVNPHRNPVKGIMYRATTDQLVHIVQQYSIFPKALVSLTAIARQKSIDAGWSELADALAKNIAEEMGSCTQGISHYTILAEGLETSLGVPVKNTVPSKATAKLLATMNAIFARQPIYVLGATYAIEATSIPELTLVMYLVELLVKGVIPENLQYFFDMHLNEWEPEHEAELKTNIEKYIDCNQLEEFEAGFRAVMLAMDDWWSDLVAEVIFSRSASHDEIRSPSFHV
jgi:hypothetical protein